MGNLCPHWEIRIGGVLQHVPNGMRTMPFPNMKIFQISEILAASGQHILIPRQPFLQHNSLTNLVETLLIHVNSTGVPSLYMASVRRDEWIEVKNTTAFFWPPKSKILIFSLFLLVILFFWKKRTIHYKPCFISVDLQTPGVNEWPAAGWGLPVRKKLQHPWRCSLESTFYKLLN